MLKNLKTVHISWRVQATEEPCWGGSKEDCEGVSYNLWITAFLQHSWWDTITTQTCTVNDYFTTLPSVVHMPVTWLLHHYCQWENHHVPGVDTQLNRTPPVSITFICPKISVVFFKDIIFCSLTMLTISAWIIW